MGADMQGGVAARQGGSQSILHVIEMQLCIPPPCSFMAYGAGVNNMGVPSSSPAQGTSVSVWASLALASAPVTCSSYYWTLFRRQSRKEERRGTLIAHLNGGCHIINAYRSALQAVTETPSHTSREEEEGEWDINSCERRDGYQRPEIKWLALKEMRPEMRHPFEFEFGVRVLHNICLSAPDLCLPICSLSHFLFLLPITCFPTCSQ